MTRHGWLERLTGGMAVLVALVGVPAAWAQTEVVTAVPVSQSVASGAVVSIALDYTSSPADPTLTGLGLRLHWDSSRLDFLGLDELLDQDRVAADAACRADATNVDQDPATDCVVSIAWASLPGDWPGGLPRRLAVARFTSRLGTGEQTSVRASAISSAAGYDFVGVPATISAGLADRDGDGVPDAEDAFPDDPGESADGDADGIGDHGDNCPLVANPDQADRDVDGVGDTCESNPFAAVPGGHVNSAASATGVVVAATLNADNQVVVFIDELGHTDWSGQVLSEMLPGPSPTGMPVAFVDPKDTLVSVAYPSAAGLMLYRRGPDGVWSLRNLTVTLGGDATPIERQLTWLISPPPGGEHAIAEAAADLISLIGMNAADQVVRYAQRRTGAVVDWTFTNLTTRDLVPRGQPAPGWVGEVVGYATPWNSQHVAGLNHAGKVVTIWTPPAPPPAPESTWLIDNLSDNAPTPPLAGGLSAYVNWGQNLTGILDDGRLGSLWWSKQYEAEQRARGSTQNWAFTILSDAAEGLRPRLRGESVVGVTTPNWVSNNIYGIAQDTGHLVAYWWGPGLPWKSTDLNARVPGSDVPTGKLTGVAAKDNSISVFGVNAEGEVLRFFWEPDVWRFENLTKAVTPGS